MRGLTNNVNWGRRWRLLSIMLCWGWIAHSQPVTVSGRVISAGDQETLIGVNILIKGTGRGTITDFDGNFELEVPSLNDTLIFSYVGYPTKEIPLAGRTRLEIVMEAQQMFIEEIVVVGYGVQRKSDLTGAISTLKSEEIQRIPLGNVEQALQGKIAGVQVTPISGEPGRGAVVRIRGTGTLNDASPLYVVDGMLLDNIDFLNPSDIESVEVLKDASATAIYGSRGANGVIIVTTRKGVHRQTVFTFNTYHGFQEVLRRIDLANGEQFATLANEVAINEGRQPLFANPAEFGEGTDWQDVVFRAAPIQNYQLSANGGSENVLFNVSANYFGQQGIVRGSDFDRITLRINNEYKFTPFVSLGHNLAFVNQRRQIGPDVITSVYRAEPIVPVFNEDGSFGDATVRVPVSNAEAQIFYNNNNEFDNRLVGNAYLDFHFLRHFTFRSNLGLDLNYGQGKSFVPVFEISPTSLQRNEESSLNVRSSRAQSWLWENTVTYNRVWNNHRLNVLAGITAQEFSFESLGGGRRNFLGETEEFFYLNAGETETQTNFNIGEEWSMASYLFRLNYTLLDRYLFTASVRADGSSRFGRENRWGVFPSFALGWNIMNEPFMDDFRLFSRLKLRGSWGRIGNDKIGAYSGRPTVTSNLNAVFNRQLQPGASIVSLANPFIKWEETVSSNVGVEMAFLQNRLQVEVDIYRRVTNDILVNVPIPSYVGADQSPVVNAAKVANQGLDLSLSWRQSRGKFNYSFGLVGSTVHNEVLALGDGQEEIFGGPLGIGGRLGTRTVVGQPIGAFYGFQVAGIFQNQQDLERFPKRGVERPGDLRFVDINGDGIIDPNDRVMIGNPIPSLIYGFNFGVGYAGLDFVAEFNGQAGYKIFNAKKMARFGTYNFESSFLDRWTGEGTSDREPRVTNGGHNYEPSERFLEDGSFMRLRALQIGYSPPRTLLERVRLSNVRVYLNATNLITWTNYSGYSPEISTNSVIDVGIDRGIYPLAKIFTVGLDANF
jgi:TonB-linked SusC/RagA family outer membrane protein